MKSAGKGFFFIDGGGVLQVGLPAADKKTVVKPGKSVYGFLISLLKNT